MKNIILILVVLFVLVSCGPTQPLSCSDGSLDTEHPIDCADQGGRLTNGTG